MPNAKGCRPHDGQGNDEPGRRGEHRLAASRQPQQRRDQQSDRHHTHPCSARQIDNERAQQRYCQQRQGSFHGLVQRRRVAYGRANSDQQRSNRHNAECAGCDPVLPDGQARHCREVEQLERQQCQRAPETAVARTAAASNPRTWRSRSRVNPEPNQRSIRPAASNASPALHKAKVAALAMVLSPSKLAAIVAAAAPIATGHLARGPSAIRAPAATPEAGQNTATPSGSVSRERPSRAARKKAMPTATATPIMVTHCRVGSAIARRGSTRLPVKWSSRGIPVLRHQSTRGRRQLERWMQIPGDVAPRTGEAGLLCF